MYIEYIDTRIGKLCQEYAFCVRKLGPRDADKVTRRMHEIAASVSLADLKKVPQAGCHRLHNEREGQYAVDLVQPRRLIFLPHNGKNEEGIFDEGMVTEVTILEVGINYH